MDFDFTDGTYLRLGEDTFTRLEPNKGYWVAYESIQTSITEIPYGTIFGIWEDTDTNRLYLDKVMFTESLDHALTVAKKHEQLAIWDIANNKEIRL